MSMYNELFPNFSKNNPLAVRVPEVGWNFMPEARESLVAERGGALAALPEDHSDSFIDAAIQQFPEEIIAGKTVRVADGQIEVFSVQLPSGRLWVVSK